MSQNDMKNLNAAGYYGPFQADRSCVVDRTGEIVLIVNPAKSQNERDAIARAFAQAANIVWAAEGEREAA